jgi:hypothetical protein
LSCLPDQHHLAPPVQQGRQRDPWLPQKFSSQTLDARTVHQVQNIDTQSHAIEQLYAVLERHIAALGIHAPAFPFPANSKTHRGING